MATYRPRPSLYIVPPPAHGRVRDECAPVTLSRQRPSARPLVAITGSHSRWPSAVAWGGILVNLAILAALLSHGCAGGDVLGGSR